MRAPRKEKPLAVCSVCHALTDRHELLNHRCNAIVNNRRCYGIYKSGLAYLWDRCEGCECTGRVGSKVCSECKGYGWKMYG